MADTLVLGGSGFIGEYVVRELSPHEVRVTDASTGVKTMRALIKEAVRILWLIPPEGNLLEELSESLQWAPKLERFVFASSLLVYANSDASQDERAPVKPSNTYGRAKLAEEEMVRHNFAANPEKLVIARLANVYGDVKSRGVVGKIFSALQGGATFVVHGDGSQRRDFIHVADAARLLVALLVIEDVSGLYNVSSGTSHALTEVIAKIERLTGKTLPVEYTLAAKEKHSITGDNGRLLKLPGIPIVGDLDTGLKKTYNHYQ